MLRLTDEEIKKIKDTIFSEDPQAEIILFGSRCDLNKRGGDIDLLVISSKIDYRKRRKLRVKLFKEFGNRKVDLLITSDPQSNTFTEIVYKYGVKL